jgi:hypothetical protein
MIINPDNTHFISGSQPTDNFTLTQVETPLTSGGTLGTAVSRDITFTINTSAGVTNNFILSTIDPAVRYSVDPSTQAAATINASTGQVVMTGGGLCNFIATKRRFGSKSYSRTMASSAATAYVGVTSYATTSLIKYLHDQMVALCTYVSANKSGSNAANQYMSDIAPSSATLMQKLIGVTGWDSFDPYTVGTNIVSGNEPNSGAIFLSPYHYIAAFGKTHQTPQIDLGRTGTNEFPNEIWLGGDIRVGHIIPGSLGGNTPAPLANVATLLPTNLSSYLPAHSEAMPYSGFPAWCRFTNPTGQNYWIRPVQCNAVFQSGFGGSTFITAPIDTALQPFSLLPAWPASPVQSGDSGSKIFVGIKGTPVLVGHVYGYGGYTDFYDAAQLQTAMNTLSTAYSSPPQTIQTINLATAGFATV